MVSMMQTQMYPTRFVEPQIAEMDTEPVAAIYTTPEFVADEPLSMAPIDVDSALIAIDEPVEAMGPPKRRGRKPKGEAEPPPPVIEETPVSPTDLKSSAMRPKTVQARQDALDLMNSHTMPDGITLYNSLLNKTISVNKAYDLVSAAVKISKPIYIKLVQEIREASES